MHLSKINKQEWAGSFSLLYCRIWGVKLNFLSVRYKLLFPEIWGWDTACTCSVRELRQAQMMFYSQPYAGKPLLDIDELKPLTCSSRPTHLPSVSRGDRWAFTNHCWRGSHRVKHLLRPVKHKPSPGCGTGAKERKKIVAEIRHWHV